MGWFGLFLETSILSYYSWLSWARAETTAPTITRFETSKKIQQTLIFAWGPRRNIWRLFSNLLFDNIMKPKKTSWNKWVTTNIMLFLKHFESTTTKIIIHHVSPWRISLSKTAGLPLHRSLFVSADSFRFQTGTQFSQSCVFDGKLEGMEGDE